MFKTELNQTSAGAKLLVALVVYFAYLASNLLNFTGPIGQWIEVGIQVVVVAIAVAVVMWQIKTVQLFKESLVAGRSWWSLIISFILVFVLVYMFGVFSVGGNIEAVLKESLTKVVSVAVTACCAGFFEEFLVRGLVLDAFVQLWQNRRTQLLSAAVSSSVIFGLLHLSNLTFQSVDATMQQVFYALILGLTLSFIRLLTNGLWVGILLHSLIDFQPTIATGGSAATNWGPLLLVFLPLFVISLLWLWFADRLLLKKKGEAPFS